MFTPQVQSRSHGHGQRVSAKHCTLRHGLCTAQFVIQNSVPLRVDVWESQTAARCLPPRPGPERTLVTRRSEPSARLETEPSPGQCRQSQTHVGVLGCELLDCEPTSESSRACLPSRPCPPAPSQAAPAPLDTGVGVLPTTSNVQGEHKLWRPQWRVVDRTERVIFLSDWFYVIAGPYSGSRRCAQ